MKKYLKQNKVLFFFTILTSVAASLGYVFMALLLQRLLDVAVERDMGRFIRLVFFSSGYFAALGVFLYLQSLLGKKMICRIMERLRSDLFLGTLSQSTEDFGKRKTADYISVITNDVKLLEDNLWIPFFETVQYSVIFLSSFGLMLYFDSIAAVCVTGAVAVMFLIPGLVGGALEKRQNKFSSKLAEFTIRLKDLLSGFEIIKSYSMGEYARRCFQRENRETTEAKYRVERLLAFNEGLSSFLALMVQIVVLFLSAYFIIIGRITAGTLLGIVQVSNNLANPLVMIFTNVSKIKGTRSVIGKIEKISRPASTGTAKEQIEALDHGICIEDLSFSYDKQKQVLEGIDCVIEKGKKYAVVGKSGCGKSTLIKLLTGCCFGYDGRILYDGRDLERLDRDAVARLSSVIHQNIYLFDETIYDNICLHQEYSKERVEQAVEESGLTGFLSELPDGLGYQAGENGADLSGGQRQRIAVARALIRHKPLLILDEGTSAVDRKTAYDIESRLLKKEDLTLITVTHHLNKELLEQYDEIIYMEDGRIKEKGNFEKLFHIL